MKCDSELVSLWDLERRRQAVQIKSSRLWKGERDGGDGKLSRKTTLSMRGQPVHLMSI